MMSNIQYNCQPYESFWFSYYEKTLQDYINKVMKAIGENDDGIKWIICEENDLPGNRKSEFQMSVEKSTGIVWCPQYGRSMPDTKTIWISKHAIRDALYFNNKQTNSILDSVIMKRPQRELLSEVIIDEFTHIKTGANHGNRKYDDLQQKYLRKYYSKDSLLNL